jgi:hypothetical protein
MKIAIHPLLRTELEALADKGFRFETSIGRVFGAIDDRFLEVADIETARANWLVLAYADNTLGKEHDLRCIDPPDGLISIIAAQRDDVLYLLSAGVATRQGRLIATRAAAERVSDLSWAIPE